MARVHAREDSHIQELITSAGEILEGTDGAVQNFLALMPDGVADQDSIAIILTSTGRILPKKARFIK